VIGATEETGVEAGATVTVTGIVQRAFDLPTVEAELGCDLDDPVYEEFNLEPYIQATYVEIGG
jgi:hypothetical protein